MGTAYGESDQNRSFWLKSVSLTEKSSLVEFKVVEFVIGTAISTVGSFQKSSICLNAIPNSQVKNDKVPSVGNSHYSSWNAKKNAYAFICLFNGIPGGIRTPDPRLRRALLYPAELLRQNDVVLSICF